MSRLNQLIRLPGADRRALVEAACCLAVASIRLRVVPFAKIAPRLGRHMAESPVADDEGAEHTIERVRWAIQAAAHTLPWRPACFPQALAAVSMLRRRGVGSTLYLGVDPHQSMEAHAWVRAGSIIVSGGPRQTRFTVVSTFG